MKIQFTFASQSFAATLIGNPTARDLLSLLPMDLKIDDYSTNEKIAYLPRKLTERGEERFGDEAIGDVCYYAPWGNLVFYYDRYTYSYGRIRLGRTLGSIDRLLTRGSFPLHAELLS